MTLKDIGQRLGLSPSQVSRALGGYPDVSEQTRQRVEEVVQQMGYRPNPNARRLRMGRSGIVGLVVPENSEQEESNILLEILLGLAQEFWKRDVLVVLNVMPRATSSTQSYTRLFRQGAVRVTQLEWVRPRRTRLPSASAVPTPTGCGPLPKTSVMSWTPAR